MRTADLRTAGRGRGVSDRAVFGDFSGAARQQLGSPAALRTAAVRGGHVPEIRHSLLRLLLVMSRYVQDITLQPVRPPSLGRPPPAGWDRAGLEAREALRRALAGLYGDTISRRRPGVQAGSELARRLDGAALSLTYGRDLLHTHLARGPRGGVRYQSEWGKVVTSPRVHQALLAELGFLARQLAPLGEDLARSPRARGSPAARQAVTGACHWLQTMDTSIRRALREDPLPAGVVELLRAVPVNSPPPRLPADATRAAGSLPGAVIDAAERARHAAWLSAAQPPWPPGMTVSSLRQVAAANTFTSRHCELLLRSLATPASGLTGEAGTAVPAAAEAAGQARVRWLGIAHALDQITTSSQEQFTPTAAAAGDLALQTGRLAHADPGWSPGSKPAHGRGPMGSLAHEPGEAARLLAAAHEACDAMNRLASADRRQVHALASAGRLLAATAPGPDTLDMLGPLAPAPPDRTGALLTLYEFTARASADATTAVSEAASAAGAPHRIALPEMTGQAGDWGDPAAEPEAAEHLAEAQAAYEPGRVEQTLRGLGITDTNLIRRGAQIDRATEQLITQAAARKEPSQADPLRYVDAKATKPTGRDQELRSADPPPCLPAATTSPIQAEGVEAEP